MIKQNFFREREVYYYGYGYDTIFLNGNFDIFPNSIQVIHSFSAIDISKALFIRLEPSHFNFHLEYRIFLNLTLLKTIYIPSGRDYSISIEYGKFTYTSGNQIIEEKFFENVKRTNEFFPIAYFILIYISNNDLSNRLTSDYIIGEAVNTRGFIQTISKYNS